MNPRSQSGGRVGKPQRLPVNPRRQKVAPEARKRVQRACNSCNVKRVKCTGEDPCQRCVKLARPCVYTAPESEKAHLRSEIETLRALCASYERRLDAAGLLPEGPSHFHDTVASSAPTPCDDVDPGRTGRMLQDDLGSCRFLGPTSGATFLNNLKDLMKDFSKLLFHSGDDRVGFLKSIGTYQTYDSRPLPAREVDPLELPSTPAMIDMLSQLRHHLQDGIDGSASGGIYWWGDLKSLPPAPSKTELMTIDTHRYLAFYHVCFALATTVVGSPFGLETTTSVEYFNRARVLIGNPLDTVKFTFPDVPTLTMMAFWLIEVNRRDAAYMYTSLAIHIAIIHGAFRECADEAKKRQLWTLYILDRWLSILMGRPPTISDNAIQFLELPCDVPAMPPSAGLRAHVELSRISSYIVCETFGIAPSRPRIYASSVQEARKRLKEWLAKLPPPLQLHVDLDRNSSLPDATCYILHMECQQLLLLIHRPTFFFAVRRAVALQMNLSNLSVPGEPYAQDWHVEGCVSAARWNIMFARRVRTDLNRKLLQAGLHFVFNAAVVLLLNQFLTIDPNDYSTLDNTNAGSSNQNDSDWSYIEYALLTFLDEAKTGTNYQIDCSSVLTDLNEMIRRYLGWVQRKKGNFEHGSDTSLRAPYPTPMKIVEEVDKNMRQWIDADEQLKHDIGSI